MNLSILDFKDAKLSEDAPIIYPSSSSAIISCEVKSVDFRKE